MDPVTVEDDNIGLNRRGDDRLEIITDRLEGAVAAAQQVEVRSRPIRNVGTSVQSSIVRIAFPVQADRKRAAAADIATCMASAVAGPEPGTLGAATLPL